MKRGELIANRFEIQEITGSGAMGVVWRALDTVGAEPVAVKILRPTVEAERFSREARLLSELDHPGIVRYVAHGRCDEGPYLVMEWLEGETLSQHLERRELSRDESLAVASGIASAIGAAHRRHVVHRDLKPSNVFLVRRSLTDVRILDFGVARQGALSSELTHTGMVIGSPRYMAPEQARGAREVGPRADVWALGAILFRCLSGRPVTVEGPVEVVLSELLFSPIPRLSDVVRDVPPALDDLLARLLAREPMDRPGDGNAVAAALAELDLPRLGSIMPSPAGEPPSLTLLEQRFTCALVIDAPELSPNLSVQLEQASARHGGAFTRSPRGSVVLFDSLGTASDIVTHAARCALEIRESAPEAAIAIATGAGSKQQAARPDSTVVTRAHTLLSENRAPAPGIVVDHAIVGLLEPRFELSVVGATHLLVSERSDPAPVRRLLGKATPCVGRARELATLEALADESFYENVARVAVVTGAAGIGKSRVRYELLRRLSRDGADRGVALGVMLGRADPVAVGSPFGVLGSALRSLFPATSEQSPLEALSARVARSSSPKDTARVTEHLAVLSGLATARESNEPTLLDPLRVGDRMRASFEEFLGAELEAHPVVIVLEDLHWGDWPSVRYVDAALRVFRDRPLFVLALGRPELSERFPGLFAERGVVRLPLTELGKRASQELVSAVLGDAATNELVTALADRADGNAFFLEELIRAVASGSAAELPASVLAMSEDRIAALEPEARQVLRAASIFGQELWPGGVAAVLSGARSERDVVDWLGRLCDRELFTQRKRSRFPGEPELAFRHALVRDAAYSMLTDDDRALGHQLAAGWLEKMGEHEDLRLAEHWFLGGANERAGPLYRRAAEHALEGNDFAAALMHAERSLACGVSGELVGDAHLIAATAHRWRGDAKECEERARLAREAYPRLSRRWYVAAAETARIASRLGRHDELSALLDELESDDATETAAVRAVVLSQLGVAALRAGASETWQRISRVLAQTEDALGPEDHDGRAWLARLGGYRALVEGDAAAYLRRTEQAVESFEKGGDSRNALTFQTSVGFANIALGRFGEAEAALSSALERAERMGLALTVAIARHNLGYALALGGRVREGLAVERQAIADAVAQGDRWIEAVSRTYLAAILLFADEPDEAERSAARAAELSDRPNRALALALQARAELRRAQPARALELARQAHDILLELGGIEDGDALVRLAWIEALEANASGEEAEQALEDAARRLIERAARIGEPELRDSFLERVPEHAETLARARGAGISPG